MGSATASQASQPSRASFGLRRPEIHVATGWKSLHFPARDCVFIDVALWRGCSSSLSRWALGYSGGALAQFIQVHENFEERKAGFKGWSVKLSTKTTLTSGGAY